MNNKLIQHKQEAVQSYREQETHQQHRPPVNPHVFTALAPVITLWGGFSVALLVTGMIVFYFVNKPGFLAFMPNVFTWAMYLLAALLAIGVLALAIKYVLGGFIIHVLGSATKVYNDYGEAREHFLKDRVHYAENGTVAFSGNIQVSHPDQNRYNYSIKQAAPVPMAEALQIAPPKLPISTGRELLLDGIVEQMLSEGYVILGFDDEGHLQKLAIKKCFSTIVSGIPAVGKSTTVFWIAGQLILIGARLWIVDPHLHFEDEDGNKSLGKELEVLADSFVFPVCDDEQEPIMYRLKFMYNELIRRQQPGFIVRAQDTILAIMDEFNSIADAFDPKLTIVIHKGQGLNFAQTLALLEREGRKYGLHFILIGHKWAKQDIGGDNAVRTNATTYMCHKMNDEGQANLLLGSSGGKKMQSLTTGSYWIVGSSWNREPMRIKTPFISAADLSVLLDIKQRRQVEVVNLNNVVDSTLEVKPLVPDQFPTSSQVVPDQEYKPNNGNQFPQGGNQPELDAVKLSLVREMVRTHRSQNEIITEVFPGMRNVDAIAAYRTYLAALLHG